MVALLLIFCLLLGVTSIVNATTGEPTEREDIRLRSRYFQKKEESAQEVFVTHTRRNEDSGKVDILSTEKLVPIPIADDTVDDLVETIATERKLQMTISEGIKRVYKMPNKNYNNKKKKSSSSSKSKSKKRSRSRQRRSTRKSRSSTATDDKSNRRKSRSTTSKSRSSTDKRSKSRSSVTDDKSSRSKSRSQRKRKKSLFKKEKDTSSRSKTKDGKSREKRTKDSSRSKSKSGNQTCKGKDEVDCRDECIANNCGFADDKMCVRKCKESCCSSENNVTGDSEDTGMGEPTAAPVAVAEGGGGPAPQPTTLQPAAPVAITPAPTVPLPEPRTCPAAVTALTAPGSLGCSAGGCCIVWSDELQDECNFQALSTSGVASIENGQIFVEDIDTSANGPFDIQEGCEISCTSECRLSPSQEIPAAPADLTTFAGPGTVSCTDGYCETTDATGCNMEGFDAVGDVGTDAAGKAIAYNIESSAASVEIEAGCLIDCSESRCTFGR